MRRLGVVLSLGLALAGAGCNEFKYFDIHVTFDGSMIPSTTVRTITVCKVTTSGADSRSFLVERNCPPPLSMPLDMGTFEYSSFADSGTLNFKFEGFQGFGEKPECLIALGMAAVPVTGETTIKADLKVGKGPSAGCGSVTPVNDGGM